MTNYLTSKTFSKLSVLTERPTPVLTEPTNPFTFDQNIDFHLNDGIGSLPMPSDITTGSTWSAGVLARNGKIYAAPISGGSVLEIDPSGSVREISITGDISGSSFSGGVVAPNGKIYAPPSAGDNVLEIDPSGSVSTRLLPIPNYETGSTWAGGVLAPDGKIHCIPFGGSNILIIEPSDSPLITTTRMPTQVSTTYYGSVLGPDGKIYGIPFSGAGDAGDFEVVVLDPTNQGFTTIPIPASIPVGNWAGGVLGPDSKIYCMPFAGSYVLVIDISTGDITVIAVDSGRSFGGWFGGVLGPNGKIYSAPNNGGKVLEIDPSGSGSTREIPIPSSLAQNGHSGCVLAPNRTIYAIPSSSQNILTIRYTFPHLMNDWILQPQFNKF